MFRNPTKSMQELLRLFPAIEELDIENEYWYLPNTFSGANQLPAINTVNIVDEALTNLYTSYTAKVELTPLPKVKDSWDGLLRLVKFKAT
jgi:hypothetical protein